MVRHIPKPLTNPFLAIAALLFAFTAFLPIFVASACFLVAMLWYDSWNPSGDAHLGPTIAGMGKVAAFWLCVAAFAVLALVLEWQYLLAIWPFGTA